MASANKELIIAETSRLLDDKNYYDTMSRAVNPYGDGKACERIVQKVLEDEHTNEECSENPDYQYKFK